jgi:hypothetical protein
VTGRVALAVLLLAIPAQAGAAERAQWTRLTALLEPAKAAAADAQNTVIPGPAFTTAEAERQGQDAVDESIQQEVEALAARIREIEGSLRLAPTMVRQYLVPLRAGEPGCVPVIDLNPRLGVMLDLARLDKDQAVLGVELRYVDGAWQDRESNLEPVTMSLVDADIREVLDAVAALTNQTVVVDSDVRAKVSVEIDSVPADHALDYLLQANGLGWVVDNGSIRIATLGELYRHRPVVAKTMVAVSRGDDSLAMVAGHAGAESPTVVLLIQGIMAAPDAGAEASSMIRFESFRAPAVSGDELEGGDLAIVRGRISTAGTFSDVAVLAAPSPDLARRVQQEAGSWRFRPVLGADGRAVEVVTGLGLRLRPLQPPPPAAAVPEHFGLELAIEPNPEATGAFLLSGQLRDLDRRALVLAPRLSCEPGRHATARSGFEGADGGDYAFELTALVDPEAKRVSCSWQVSRGNRIVASSSLVLRLE